jgi:hypothetical protein
MRGFWSRMRDGLADLIAAEPSFERVLVDGPDPIDPDEEPGPLETLLPWPVRLMVVGALWIIGRIWYDAPPAQQLSWGLAYAGAIAVSIEVSFARLILAINFVLGGLWWLLALFPVPSKSRNPLLWYLWQTIEFVNRQISHLEAFWIWMALALTWKPRIQYQLPALAAVFLLGPPIINGLTRVREWRRAVADRQPGTAAGAPPPALGKATGELQWARRPLIYWTTLLGLLILLLRTWDSQAKNLVPLAIAVSLGAAFRLLRHETRRQRLDQDRPEDRALFRQAHRQFTRPADIGLGPVLVLGALVSLIALSVNARARLDAHDRSALDGPEPSADNCTPAAGGPVAGPQVRLMLMADTQIHELGGERFPGQMELADALVPVALRPVELDILSAAPLWRLARYFKEELEGPGAAPRPGLPPTPAPGPIFWAHLGDFGDLSCRGEMKRAFEIIDQLPRDRMAGLAPGNHDMSFTGNFYWSPFWSDACQTGRMEKMLSTSLLAKLAREVTGSNAREVSGGWLPSWLGGRAGALVSIRPLGEIKHRNQTRGLAAIFVDTADGQDFDYGIAGMFGTFSRAQDSALRTMVDTLAQRAGPKYEDPIWIVLAHHPMSEMAPASGQRLLAFIGWLDGRRRPEGADPEPRALALVTAHTHHAESHGHCVGNRVLREMVIGSTIDPPQQAALVQVGADADGLASLRLRTIPVVGRTGFLCGNEQSFVVEADRCRRIVAGLRATPSCAPLFEAEDGLARDCAELERSLTLRERIAGLTIRRGPFEPEEIKQEQRVRANTLLACVCRERPGGGRACNPPPVKDPFDNDAYHGAIMQQLAGDPDRGDELTCLAWAAAAVQQHKGTGMSFAEALRCAYDDPSLVAAQETIATLEARACR